MTFSPFVSIIIPVYNGANYLRDAIDSALAQTYREKEIIVVDDGSTDGGETEAICRSYGDRIRFYKKENGGVATALNRAIGKMRGDYFSWLSHDDIYFPSKLERQIEALSQVADKATIVHGNYELLNTVRGTVSRMRQEAVYSVEQLTKSVFPVLTAVIHGCTPLIHRSHFERVGLFDERQPLTQDYDFLFRALRGKRSLFLSEPLVRVRLHDQAGRVADGRFAEACAEQYVHFLDALSYDEVRGMFASPRAFYYRIAAMVASRLHGAASEDIVRRLAQLPEEPVTRDEQKLRKCIERLGGGRMRKICIFGAGFRGRTLQFELRGRGMEVDCFCDNDVEKQGGIINGSPCVSVARLQQEHTTMLVIVAADDSDPIMTQLKGLGIAHLASKYEIDALLLECPPLHHAGEFV